MTIDVKKFYTLTEVLAFSKQGHYPIKARRTLLDLIAAGKLKAVNVTAGKKPHWQIQGQSLKDFMTFAPKPTKEKHDTKRTKKTSSVQKTKAKVHKDRNAVNPAKRSSRPVLRKGKATGAVQDNAAVDNGVQRGKTKEGTQETVTA